MRLVLQQMLFPHSRESSSNAIKNEKALTNAQACLCLYNLRSWRITGPCVHAVAELFNHVCLPLLNIQLFSPADKLIVMYP